MTGVNVYFRLILFIKYEDIFAFKRQTGMIFLNHLGSLVASEPAVRRINVFHEIRQIPQGYDDTTFLR